MPTLMVGWLGLALAAFVLPVQHLSASRSIGPTAVANAWKGDVPDLVVVAERASPLTTVYTQSRDGQWGDIPDQIIIATRPVHVARSASKVPEQWGDIPDLVVTAQPPAAQPHRELAATRPTPPARHRL